MEQVIEFGRAGSWLECDDESLNDKYSPSFPAPSVSRGSALGSGTPLVFCSHLVVLGLQAGKPLVKQLEAQGKDALVQLP